MNALPHFVAGLAAASVVPGVLAAAMAGRPGLLLAGGFAALLPDIIDRRVLPYLIAHAWRITPDPRQPNPSAPAQGLLAAAVRAFATGQIQTVKFDPIRTASAHCVPYAMVLQSDRTTVEARLDAPPTGQTGSARVQLPGALDFEGPARMPVDAEGADLAVVPGPGRLELRFQPWHRTATHSAPIILLLGLAVGLIHPSLAAALALAGFSHLLLDWVDGRPIAALWPFRPRRQPGWRPGHPLPALVRPIALGAAGLLLAWNVYLAQPLRLTELTFPRVVFWGIGVPLLIHAATARRHKIRDWFAARWRIAEQP